MSFQISALSPDQFAPLFALSDDELKTMNARRMVVAESPGVPCRVSMADAEVGDTVILLNYQHQPADSPYQGTHAIYVRKGVEQAALDVGEVPAVLTSRLISLRLFDDQDMMIDADVVDGADLSDAIKNGFADDRIAYAHLHIAKPGCFAASVARVG